MCSNVCVLFFLSFLSFFSFSLGGWGGGGGEQVILSVQWGLPAESDNLFLSN